MIQASARKPKAGANILGFKVRQFLKNLLGSQTIRQKIQHITNYGSAGREYKGARRIVLNQP